MTIELKENSYVLAAWYGAWEHATWKIVDLFGVLFRPEPEASWRWTYRMAYGRGGVDREKNWYSFQDNDDRNEDEMLEVCSRFFQFARETQPFGRELGWQRLLFKGNLERFFEVMDRQRWVATTPTEDST